YATATTGTSTLSLQTLFRSGRDDLHFVAELVREQRADRAVDQAAGQRFLLGGAALALEEAAGDAAAGIELLLVVDGERKEVLPRSEEHTSELQSRENLVCRL